MEKLNPAITEPWNARHTRLERQADLRFYGTLATGLLSLAAAATAIGIRNGRWVPALIATGAAGATALGYRSYDFHANRIRLDENLHSAWGQCKSEPPKYDHANPNPYIFQEQYRNKSTRAISKFWNQQGVEKVKDQHTFLWRGWLAANAINSGELVLAWPLFAAGLLKNPEDQSTFDQKLEQLQKGNANWASELRYTNDVSAVEAQYKLMWPQATQ